MKTTIMVLLTIWGAFASKMIFAQAAGKLTGQVTDAARKPVDGATITLVTAKDSVLIKTELAATDGTFVFEQIKDGDYKIVITTVGFKNYHSQVIRIDPQNIVIA